MRKSSVYLCLALLIYALIPDSSVMALGTPAGTVINNKAYVDYNDANGNALPRIFSNTVQTVVSQVAGIDIRPPSGQLAGANGQIVYFDIDIENIGNGIDSFSGTYTVDSGWTPVSVSFYNDVNDNGVYDSGVDTFIGTGTGPHMSPPLAADSHLALLMAVEIPDIGVAPDTSTSQITITGTSQFNNTVSDYGTYITTVATAVISAIKSHSPATAKPGDVLTYTITLTNTGSTAGTTVIVTDPVPSGITYEAGSIKVNNVTKTDVSGDDEADFNNITKRVSYSLGTIAAGDSMVVSFKAKVDNNVTAGTSIQNQATVTYVSGGSPVTENTNGDEITVANAPGIDLTPGTTSATGDPGDSVNYTVTITNNGNAPDTIDLTVTSSAGFPYVLWIDANNDGIPGNDGDTMLVDTDGDGKIDTGLVNPGGIVNIIATAIIPAGTSDGTVDNVIITGTSSIDTNIKDTTGTLQTTVTAPVLTIIKEVSPTGPQPPGTILTYTVTVQNTGTGTATNVIISDLRPTYTTYLANSLKTGSSLASLVSRSDANDGDGAQYDSGTNTVVSGNGNNTIGAGGKFILQFKVTIN